MREDCGALPAEMWRAWGIASAGKPKVNARDGGIVVGGGSVHSRPMSTPPDPRFRLRLVFTSDDWMGPGKAELLERIDRTGSIAAAGREMGMSYKRAWQLVEAMNAMFRAPLVVSSRGGAKGGGAVVTEEGQVVLAEFRALEEVAQEAGADHIARLQQMLGDISDGE